MLLDLNTVTDLSKRCWPTVRPRIWPGGREKVYRNVSCVKGVSDVSVKLLYWLCDKAGGRPQVDVFFCSFSFNHLYTCTCTCIYIIHTKVDNTYIIQCTCTCMYSTYMVQSWIYGVFRYITVMNILRIQYCMVSL